MSHPRQILVSGGIEQHCLPSRNSLKESVRRKQIARLGKCLVPLRHITHILLFLIIAAAAPAQPVVEIETIDGLLTSGTIESINARQVIFQNTLATVQTARMRRMVFLENTRREPCGAGSMVEVRLASGGRLFATDVIIGQLDARVYLSTADQHVYEYLHAHKYAYFDRYTYGYSDIYLYGNFYSDSYDDPYFDSDSHHNAYADQYACFTAVFYESGII